MARKKKFPYIVYLFTIIQHVDPFVLALVTLTPGARCTKMHVFRCRNLCTHKMGNAQKQLAQKQLTKKRNCELQVRVEQIDRRKQVFLEA